MNGMFIRMAPLRTAATASARRARLVANFPTLRAWLVLGATATLLLAVTAADVWAQSGSLYARQPGQGPWRAKETSFIFQEFEPPKEYQLHDIVVVIVDENTRVLSEGEINRKKKADGSMTLSDWIGLDTWAIRPDPQSAGDPTVSGKMSNKYKAEGELETRESLKLTIACTVVESWHETQADRHDRVSSGAPGCSRSAGSTQALLSAPWQTAQATVPPGIAGKPTCS